MRRTGRLGGRGAWRLGLLVGLALAGSLLAGCGSTQVVGSKPLHFFVELPSGWAVFDKAQIEKQGVVGDATAPEYLAVFSASPHPKVQDLNSASAYPWGIVEVKSLPHSQALALSLEGLNNELFNVDQMSAQGESVQALAPPKMVVSGSLRGVSASFEVPTVGDTVEDYQITSWVNSSTDQVWVLALGCSPTCFQADQSSIGRVMRTFSVQDKEV